MAYLQIVLFALLVAGLLLVLRINPLRLRPRIALTANILKEKRSRITKNRIKKRDYLLIRLHTLLEQSQVSRGRFSLLVLAAFLAGAGFGYLMFNGLLLSFSTGLAALPLPLLFLRLKAQTLARRQVESLANTMSIITNAYIACDDIVKAVEQYVREKNRYLPDELRQATPFDEFVSEIVLINPNVERGLHILAAKINNRYFNQWAKMLILCHEDRRLKFALTPIIDAMNDAKGMQLESDAQMAKTWRDYFLTVGLSFAIIPIMRFSNDAWFYILTQTPVGKGLILLMLILTLVTAFLVLKINKPLMTL